MQNLVFIFIKNYFVSFAADTLAIFGAENLHWNRKDQSVSDSFVEIDTTVRKRYGIVFSAVSIKNGVYLRLNGEDRIVAASVAYRGINAADTKLHGNDTGSVAYLAFGADIGKSGRKFSELESRIYAER